uniref:Centrosomal protein of 135 kDa n=1 Tax=Mesocestoides corti TaxID=53468 RepID=A0A5K3FCS5_MESCO
MVVVSEETFRGVRKKLHVLGYNEPLSIDSVLLVERLLDDLVLTTHSLRETKKELASKLCAEQEHRDLLLQSENASDKNETYHFGCGVSDTYPSCERRIKAIKSKPHLLDANSRGQIFNSSLVDIVNYCDKVGMQISGPSSEFPNNIPDLTTISTCDRTQKVHCEPQPRNVDAVAPPVHPGNNASNYDDEDAAHPRNYCCSVARLLDETERADNPETVDLVKAMTQHCRDLEASLRLLEQNNQLTEARISTFKTQIELRNEEIDRLRQIIDGEKRPLDSIVMESQQRQTDRIIEQLQFQVDLLQMRNQELEKRLLARVESAFQPTQSPPLEKRERASQCSIMENTSDARELPCLLRTDRWEMVEMLDNFEKTNKHYLGRVDELVNSQKKMVLEIDRLKRLIPPTKKPTPAVRRGPTRITNKKASPSTLNAPANPTPQLPDNCEPPVKAYIEGLIADRQTLRTQVDYLTQCMRRWFATPTQNAAIVPAGDCFGSDTFFTRDNQNVHVQTTESNSSKVAFTSNDASVRKALDMEVNPETDAELQAVKKERNELQAALNKFERSLLEIQEEVRSLQSERDNLLIQLDEARHSLATISEAPTKNHHSHDAASQSLEPCTESHEHRIDRGECCQRCVEALEAHRVDHCGEVLPSSINRATSPMLKTQLALETEQEEQLRAEIRCLSQTLSGTQKQLDASRKRNDELANRVLQLNNELEELLQTSSEKEEAAKTTEQLQAALAQTRAQNSALASELSMRKDMYNELGKEKQLSDAMAAEAQRDLQCLNSRISELDMELRRTREDVARLQKVASQLDAEKDALQSALDDRTEELVALKQDATGKAQLLEENERYLSNAELRLRRLTETAADRDREVRALTERLHELENSSKIVNQSRAISEEKYAKAKADVAVLTNEIESLTSRLQEATNANIELEQRLSEAVRNFVASEQAMEAKLREHSDLLLHYSSLSKEFEATSKRNLELEQSLRDLEKGLQDKEASLRVHLERAQKAELDALNSRRELLVAEEKV